MIALLFVSFVWAFSFGLIKEELSGVNPELAGLLRLCISLLVFVPFLRIKSLGPRLCLRLMAVGAVQYGLMYVTYISSFTYLQAHQVAMMTITTPLYVAIIAGLYQRQLNIRAIVAVIGAIAGALIIVMRSLTPADFGLGMILLQISNVCFAWGQVYYRKLAGDNPKIKTREVFAVIYLGAVITAAAATASSRGFSGITELNLRQWAVIFYLGALASGLCFFLWNWAAVRVRVGTLAAANNLKIPLAITCSLLFFGETVNIPRLIIGGGIIAAVFVWSSKGKRR
ncbi:carboxylate/amino acid/amine transporter [Limihaloglobus sulfuriphilus]|uniref:Carboxylate/amino acid/amine transporter n=1 Tax=Limihaloglobus sulfuriphilus TaxID=1851148 RepID=A0A1Q2MH07_9BACT|nr:EamA family transporter [Limihaloglobus sulfuriphilus]AQQ71934.1 carboxylate/amino acid/amine transporter [Limihaloglobus sulfuriphilus]